MYEPERPLEPPEPRPVTCCCECGEVIYEGDGYYKINDTDYCEACGMYWLDQRRRVARREDRE